MLLSKYVSVISFLFFLVNIFILDLILKFILFYSSLFILYPVFFSPAYTCLLIPRLFSFSKKMSTVVIMNISVIKNKLKIFSHEMGLRYHTSQIQFPVTLLRLFRSSVFIIATCSKSSNFRWRRSKIRNF